MRKKRWFGKSGSRVLAGVFCLSLLMAEFAPAQYAYAMEKPAQYEDENREQSAPGLSEGETPAESSVEETGQETTDKPEAETGQEVSTEEVEEGQEAPAEEAGEEQEVPAQDDGPSDKDVENPVEEMPIPDKAGGETSDMEDEETPIDENDSTVSENTVEDDEVSISENAVSAEAVSVSENALTYDDGVQTMVVPEDAIASGTVDEPYGKMTWVIDRNGKLIVEGTGDYADPESKGTNIMRAPWLNSSISIRIASAEIRVTGMKSAANMFYGCQNLISVDLSGLDTSQMTNMASMFEFCYSLRNIQFAEKPASGNVTDMSNMFHSCTALENTDFMKNIDTGNVTDMSGMFDNCKALKNVDGMKNIDTGNVKNMNSLFKTCVNLEQVDLSGWDTANVTDMGSMFCDCGFRRITLGGKFTTRNAENMDEMFKVETRAVWGYPEVISNQDRRNLNGLDGLEWLNLNDKKRMSKIFDGCRLKAFDLASLDTDGITKLPKDFFYGCDLTGVDFSRLKTDTITDMSYLFYKSIGDVDLRGLHTSNVTSMEGMFSNEGNNGTDCELTSLDVSGFDTGKVTNMSSMFFDCSGLTSLDVSGFDTGNVTNMSSMFFGCSGLTSLDVSGFDTGKVTEMSSMFQGCGGLTSLDVSGFDTGEVKGMSQMFFDCSGLTSLDVSGFDTGKVTVMSGMFFGCGGVTILDVSGFDTGSVEDIQGMFADCRALESLNLSGFDLWTYTSQSYHVALPYGDALFGGCDSLTKLYTPYNLNVFINEKYWISSGLPGTAEGDDKIYWYDAAGNAYEKLPALGYSIYLEKGSTPKADAARLAVSKRKTFYGCGEEVMLDDLRVRYYGVDGTVRELHAEDYMTDAASIDTSKTGPQTLTVTYTAGDGAVLTAQITLTFAKLLNGAAKITFPDSGFTYDGKEKKPEPTVTYTLNGTTVTLTEGMDYTVSYQNNINAYPALSMDGTDTGAPAVIIKGMGEYSGSVSRFFTIKKAAAPEAEELRVTASGCTEARERRTIDLSDSFLSYGRKTGYAVTAVTDDKNIFSRTPAAGDIDSTGVLTYGTVAAADGDTAVITIKVSFSNYEDAELKVTVTMSSKQAAVITGLSMAKQTVYRGTAISYTGTAIVKDEDGKELTGMSLVCSYAGTLADGTAYPAQTEAPVHTGSYKMTVSVESADYEGSVTYAFEIIPASLTVRAKDTMVLRGTQAEMLVYEYETEGLLEGDALKTEPFYSLTDEAGTAVSEPDLTKEGRYFIKPYGADAGADYRIAYESGILTVADERVTYTVTFDLMGHGQNLQKDGIKTGSLLDLSDTEKEPVTDGFVFAGWYKEKSFADKQKWNFDTDTVQKDLTLYARWLVKTDGLRLCVQEIPDLIYTGSALKPAVAVYDGDGETLLKSGKDYTVRYYKNTDAVAVGEDGKPFSAGGLAQVTAGGRTENILGIFDDQAPYVAITGKGNYSGTVYRNFVILPADISGFALTYTDQFEAKPGKTVKVVKSVKNDHKKALKADRDFTFTVQDTNGQEVTLTNGQLPLNGGTYTLTVTGKGNYTGAISGKPLYVAEKAKLMKNASVTYTKTLPAVNTENLRKGITQTDVTVKINGKVVPEKNAENLANYEITYADNDKIGTASMVLTGRNGYVGTKTVTFKIAGVSFNTKNIDVKEGVFEDGTGFVKEMVYTGKALTQNKVKLTTKAFADNTARELVFGTDYMISYKNNVKKGNATVIFTAKPQSGFSGSIKKTFRIGAQNLSETMFVKVDGDGKLQKKSLTVTGKNEQKHSVSVTWDEDAVYTKSGAAPAVILRNESGMILKQGTDYTVSCKDNQAATKENGSAASPKAGSKQPLMTIKGKGNYAGTLIVAYQIVPASLGEENADLWPATAQVQKKDGLKLKDLKLKLFEKKTALRENKDYTIFDESGCTPEIIKAYADALGTDAQAQTAEPKVILHGTGNYTGTREVSLADAVYLTKFANNKNVTVKVVGDTVYTGENLTPAVEVTYYEKNYDGTNKASGKVLTEGTDYLVVYGDKNIQAGKNKGTVTVTGVGVYGGSVTVKFSIGQKQICVGRK